MVEGPIHASRDAKREHGMSTPFEASQGVFERLIKNILKILRTHCLKMAQKLIFWVFATLRIDLGPQGGWWNLNILRGLMRGC